jgi:hypothetical protein
MDVSVCIKRNWEKKGIIGNVKFGLLRPNDGAEVVVPVKVK